MPHNSFKTYNCLQSYQINTGFTSGRLQTILTSDVSITHKNKHIHTSLKVSRSTNILKAIHADHINYWADHSCPVLWGNRKQINLWLRVHAYRQAHTHIQISELIQSQY